MATTGNNHETRISVLEANHETLKTSLSEIRGELHGLRTAFDDFRKELSALSERLIKSWDATANCQNSVIPAILDRLNGQEARISDAEKELNDSRAFKGTVRAWKPALITAVITSLVAVIAGAVKLAIEVYWRMQNGGL